MQYGFDVSKLWYLGKHLPQSAIRIRVQNVMGLCTCLHSSTGKDITFTISLSHFRWRFWDSFDNYVSNEAWFVRIRQRFCAECHVNQMLKKLTYRCVRLMLADDEDLEEALAIVEDETSSKEMVLLTLMEFVKGPPRLLFAFLSYIITIKIMDFQ